jgi:hypothetical protein
MSVSARVRILASTVLLAVALGTAPSSALAATGYAHFDPQSAHVGEHVKAQIEDYNCNDYNRRGLPIRFVKPDAGAVVATVEMERTFVASYLFVVPTMPPGEYLIEVLCSRPDGWIRVSVDGSDSGGTFTVLGGAPDTDTADPLAQTRPTPRWWWLVLVVAWFAGAGVTLARPALRPRSPRR